MANWKPTTAPMACSFLSEDGKWSLNQYENPDYFCFKPNMFSFDGIGVAKTKVEAMERTLASMKKFAGELNELIPELEKLISEEKNNT